MARLSVVDDLSGGLPSKIDWRRTLLGCAVFLAWVVFRAWRVYR
jgi:hypothetical protein